MTEKSACLAGISGKMHYSLCVFAPMFLSALFSGSQLYLFVFIRGLETLRLRSGHAYWDKHV